MSVTAAPPNSRRTFVLALVLCIVLAPLLQAGLGFLSLHTSSPWFWRAGTPIAYLLIGGLAAFCGTGGLPATQARGRAAQIAVVGSLLGALLAALIVATFILAWIHVEQTAPPSPPVAHSLGGPGLAILIIIFYFVPMFVVTNLLGVALAPLGGLLGGWLRASIQPVDAPAQGVPSVSESPRGRIGVIAVVVVAMVLALLVGVAGLLLITGAFSTVG